jgi:hypothetical protein
MSRAIPLLSLWALGGLLYGDLYLSKRILSKKKALEINFFPHKKIYS